MKCFVFFFDVAVVVFVVIMIEIKIIIIYSLNLINKIRVLQLEEVIGGMCLS